MMNISSDETGYGEDLNISSLIELWYVKLYAVLTLTWYSFNKYIYAASAIVI